MFHSADSVDSLDSKGEEIPTQYEQLPTFNKDWEKVSYLKNK